MTDQSTLPCWTFSIPGWCYGLQCAVATIVLRVVFFGFRAAAVIRGDFPYSKLEPGTEWTFLYAFWQCFMGYGRSKAHADLWLNAFIGFFELATYPILLRTNHLTVIGGWLALKTAGSWGGWKVSRTSFNRFLLNNILELAIAFWLTRYVSACSP